jgi:hypothetical protein
VRLRVFALVLFVTATASAKDPQIEQYETAIVLHGRGFPIAAYGIFAEIATHPTHPRYQATLPWLEKISHRLPEPEDVVEWFGYDEAAVERVPDRKAAWHLYFLMGRYAFRNRRYDYAVKLFAKVDRESPYWKRAQIIAGIAHVMEAQLVPAIRSFRPLVPPDDEGASREAR